MAFVTQLYNVLISCVLGAIGDAFIRWRMPWSKAEGGGKEEQG
jgi:hypothetical protein